MYKIIARDAYDMSETEYEVGRFEYYEDAYYEVKELEYESRQTVSLMQDEGYTIFYRIVEEV